MLVIPGAASGQGYPEKPIRLLTPPPGGSTEFTSRLLAEALAPSLAETARMGKLIREAGLRE
jgi:tripartite-type tricarboxylate transporter receptor subunit TctC